MKLQFAAKGTSTSCASPGGSSSTYADVSPSSGVIRFYDNSNPSSSTLLMASSSDPDHNGDTNSNQTYQEDNTFTNSISSITAGQDGMWDFSLVDNSAPTSTIYCFRAVKSDGSALDTYEHYPEAVTDVGPEAEAAPSVSSMLLNNGSNITLIENTSTTVSVTATIQDTNGWSNIAYATSVIYRSGATTACTADQNNCYRMASTSCALSSCTGNSCTVTCSANLQYFAESTDDASGFVMEDWRAHVTAVDYASMTGAATTTIGIELNSLYGIQVTNSINYGVLSAGANSESTNRVATSTNTGNIALDVSVSGQDMVSGIYSIGISNQKFATTTFTYLTCTNCVAASTTATTSDIALPKPTSTTAIATPLYWGILVPTTSPPLVFTGTTTFTSIDQVNVARKWTLVTSTPGWGGRKSALVLQYKQKLWIMGGYTATTTTSGANDVWWSSDGLTWTQATSAAAWPARYSMTGVVYNDKMWVMGGVGCGSRCGDVWWSTDGVTWVQATGAPGWTAREAPRSVVYDDKMWILGGYIGTVQNDVWYSTNGVSWTQATSSANWTDRYYHTALVYNNKMWVIGGWAGADKNDVWSSSDGVSWTQATSAAAWPVRWQINGAVFNNRMWIIGGYRTTGGYIGDVWSSQDGVTWTNVPVGTTTNTYRADSPFVPYNDAIYGVGGDASGTMVRQIWKTNP